MQGSAGTNGRAPGEHFWALVGRLGVALGVPFMVPVLLLAFWLGRVSEQTSVTAATLEEQAKLLSSVITLTAAHNEKLQAQSTNIEKLQLKVDEMLRTVYGNRR